LQRITAIGNRLIEDWLLYHQTWLAAILRSAVECRERCPFP
jgi:hypothetical protein